MVTAFPPFHFEITHKNPNILSSDTCTHYSFVKTWGWTRQTCLVKNHHRLLYLWFKKIIMTASIFSCEFLHEQKQNNGTVFPHKLVSSQMFSFLNSSEGFL